jgi:polysaccharide export outer membrane protein
MKYQPIISVVTCCALSLAAVGDARAAETVVAAIPSGESPPTAPADQQPTKSVDEYRIGPGDLIEFSVFQVPELSRTVRVSSRGFVSLPLIGAVPASGRTPEQLETLVAKKLSENYLQDPQVSVFIKEYVSQRVTVEGSVQRAGIFPLTGRTTLLQAIAMASGVDPLANQNEVKIFREKNGTRQTLVYNLEEIRAGKADDPEIEGNDVVVVDKSGTRSAIKTVTDTIRGILSFGRL